jgi:hypothetical protein
MLMLFLLHASCFHAFGFQLCCFNAVDDTILILLIYFDIKLLSLTDPDRKHNLPNTGFAAQRCTNCYRLEVPGGRHAA